MIDEKTLIEVMLKSREREHGTVASLIDWFIQVVEACPKVAEWIPCSEPPEKEDTYLVAWLPTYTTENGDTRFYPCEYPHYYMLADYYDEEWDFNLPDAYKGEEAVLLAWQPLPPAYKGE